MGAKNDSRVSAVPSSRFLGSTPFFIAPKGDRKIAVQKNAKLAHFSVFQIFLSASSRSNSEQPVKGFSDPQRAVEKNDEIPAEPTIVLLFFSLCFVIANVPAQPAALSADEG
jgi:hypothetical protein